VIEHNDNGLEPLGPNPADYGFPEKPTRTDQRVWDTQQRFYEDTPNAGSSCSLLLMWVSPSRLSTSGSMQISSVLTNEWNRHIKHIVNH
jgi:hypothetical protein